METDATENKSYAHISEQLSGRDSCLKKSFQCKNLLSTKKSSEFPRKLLGFIAVLSKTMAKSKALFYMGEVLKNLSVCTDKS